MHVVAIVQARMGSTRLPGKVMQPLAGFPAIWHVLERARRIPGVDEVVLATSHMPGEEPLVNYVRGHRLARVVCGSEDDTLARYSQAAAESGADVVVRLTGDCPLLDPAQAGRVVALLLGADGKLDYTNNTFVRTLPRGLDAEAFHRAVLDTAAVEAHEQPHREHVTPFIWSQPDRFRLAGVVDSRDRSHHRWTLDTPDDLGLLTRIFREIGPSPDMSYEEVLGCVEAHPDWSLLNAHIEQKKVLGATI